MNWTIGIDIGGTVIKAVAATEDGAVQQRATLATNARTDTVAVWAEHMRRLVADFERSAGSSAAGIGVCAPGLASPDARCIKYLPGKLAGLEGFDWTRALGRSVLVPVINDAHGALLGEAWVGAARGRRHAVLFTLGTGVGGAVMSDGRLLCGAIGRAGHLGHMSLDIDGQPSITGTPGALEVMFGDYTVLQRTGGRFTSTAMLVAAHQNGDAAATRVWLRSVRALACALASTINILDPEIIVLAGGITLAGDALLQPLRAELDRIEWRPGGHAVPLVLATLGEWAGAVGAAHVARQPAPLLS